MRREGGEGGHEGEQGLGNGEDSDGHLGGGV